MHGQCAHPLDIGADMKRADDLSQFTRHRLLKRQQFDRGILRRAPLLRDVVMVGDHLFGQRQVRM